MSGAAANVFLAITNILSVSTACICMVLETRKRLKAEAELRVYKEKMDFKYQQLGAINRVLDKELKTLKEKE